MKIYAVKKNELEGLNKDEAMQLTDAKRRQRINQIKLEEDRLRSIGAGLLLRYAYLKAGHTVEDWNSLDFMEGENGKPFLSEEQFFFSLSHSGDWVVCAVDSQIIGIDIEQMKDCKLQVAKRFFALKEYEQLQAQGENRVLFYKMWTAKESYTKMTGTGLTVPMSEIVCEVENNYILDCESMEYTRMHYIEEIENYMICICVKEEKTELPCRMEILSGRQLLEGCYAECEWKKCGKKG